MKVFLSSNAKQKLAEVSYFIKTEFSYKSLEKFLEKFDKSLNQISEFPKSCKKSTEFNNLYKCMFSKQTCYYYRIYKNEIEIITLTDNRQNPSHIQSELNKLF